jgi:general stress protein CsbA
MSSAKKRKTQQQKEYVADLLKERIYATLALLAVLISIDTAHSNSLHAAYIITGTIISLWAASIVATQMSRRMVFQGELNHTDEVQHQFRRHAPMLASLVFPLAMIGLSSLHVLSLGVAVDVSIISSLLLLVGWSLASARSLQANKLPMFVLVIVELAIGLAIVGLKIVVGH